MNEKMKLEILNKRYILILFLILALVINNFYVSLIINTIVIIVYSIFFYKKTRFLFLYSLIIFTLLRLIISLYILEYSNVFLVYSNQYTFYKGSMNEFLIISIMIIEISYKLYKKIKFPIEDTVLLKYFRNKIYYLILIIILITDLRFIILRYKFGYIHRVEFASKFLENTIFNHFIQIMIMGGIILAGIILKYSKIKGSILIILLSTYSYLIGEKFGYFFVILCFLLLGISINTTNKQCKFYFKYAAFFLVGVIFCCISVVSTMYKINYKEAVDFFKERIYQDNESWWYFYDKEYKDLEIINEIKAIRYKGIGDLYEIGYENARLFGSHLLAEKIEGYETVKGEYERKRRIAAGSMAQIKLYGRKYYFLLLIYIYMLHFILKNIVYVFKIKSKNFLINMLLFIYISILIRFYIQVDAGLMQINNDFFSIKAVYFLLIIWFYKLFIHVLKNVRKFESRRRKEEYELID